MATDNPITEIKHSQDELILHVTLMSFTEIIWGEMVARRHQNFAIWFNMASAPQFIHLYNANVTVADATSGTKRFCPKLIVPTVRMAAFLPHLTKETGPLGYEDGESGRHMVPVTASVGNFHFDGFFHLASGSTVDQYVEASKEVFIPLYNVTFTSPILSHLAPFRAPYTIIRKLSAFIAPREV